MNVLEVSWRFRAGWFKGNDSMDPPAVVCGADPWPIIVLQLPLGENTKEVGEHIARLHNKSLDTQ